MTHLSKLVECATPRVNPRVDWALVNDTVLILAEEVCRSNERRHNTGNSEGYEGIYGNLVFFSQFF